MSEPFLIGDAMTGGYGKGPDILHGCTIAVEKGEIAVIVGPNGAGKSTAMKAVFGMLNVHSGAVRGGGGAHGRVAYGCAPPFPIVSLACAARRMPLMLHRPLGWL